MPRVESASPLPRALACVMCPISFEPRGMMVFPSAFTSEVVFASTASPALAFLLSMLLLSVALMTVPLANPLFADAPFWFALALVEAAAAPLEAPVVEPLPLCAFASCDAEVSVLVPALTPDGVAEVVAPVEVEPCVCEDAWPEVCPAGAWFWFEAGVCATAIHDSVATVSTKIMNFFIAYPPVDPVLADRT